MYTDNASILLWRQNWGLVTLGLFFIVCLGIIFAWKASNHSASIIFRAFLGVLTQLWYYVVFSRQAAPSRRVVYYVLAVVKLTGMSWWPVQLWSVEDEKWFCRITEGVAGMVSWFGILAFRSRTLSPHAEFNTVGLRLQPLTGALSAYSAKNARWHPSSLHEQLFSKYASSRHIEHALSFVYFGLSPFSPLKCAVVDAGRRFHLWMRQMGHSEVCDLIFAILQLPHFTLLHVVGLHVTDNFKMRGVATMDVEEISWSANNRSVNSRASRPSVSDNKPAWFEVCEEDLVLSQSWNVFQGWSAVRICRWWRLFALIFSVCVLFRFLCVRDTCLDYNIVIYMTTGQLLAKYKVITNTTWQHLSHSI